MQEKNVQLFKYIANQLEDMYYLILAERNNIKDETENLKLSNAMTALDQAAELISDVAKETAVCG